MNIGQTAKRPVTRKKLVKRFRDWSRMNYRGTVAGSSAAITVNLQLGYCLNTGTHGVYGREKTEHT